MQKEKPHINLVVIGHVDCGKSTLIGHLLFKCGAVRSASLKEYEMESIEWGKGSFKYAWIVNKLKTERERGITIDFHLSKFVTLKHYFTLIDVPGHRDFIKNMIVGTSQADVALLVVAASHGEFEAGLSNEGQTREHALISFTLGVKQMIVLINKMDSETVVWKEDRFLEVKKETENYLKKVGYVPDKVHFVPVSGWLGDNLIEASPNMPWYKGPTLIQALDSVFVPVRPLHKPLRIPIQNVYKIGGVGTVATGCVGTGVLKPGTILSFSPSKLETECRSIEMHYEAIEKAVPGDNVGFNFRVGSQYYVRRGYICGDKANDPPKEAASFEAQIIVLRHPSMIKPGYSPVIYCHTAQVACKFEALRSKIDKRTGKEIEANPKFIRMNDSALVKIVPLKPLCIEAFKDYPTLGRFIVRDLRDTVAVGVVRSVERVKGYPTTIEATS